jgi:energy-coupling factor transporter ATP-binding protein EcfA2
MAGDNFTSSNAATYAAIVRRMAVDRRMLGRLLEAADSLRRGDRPAAVAHIETSIAAATDDTPTTRRAVDIGDFLSADEPEYRWVVEHLLERGDRLILTGPEGGGKSTLLRQIAVMLAAGIHPFDHEHEINAARVLLVDLENPTTHYRRELRKLHRLVPNRIDPGDLRVISAPAGIDLLDPTDAAWLEAETAGADLLAIGPLYKLANGDPTSEEVGKAVSRVLDRIRVQHDTAVILEAHSPHAVNGGKRPLRPYGWSGWLRWPEFGIHLDEKGPLTHWRGARDQRDFPAALERGGPWPWTAITGGQNVTFAQMLQAVADLQRVPSNRELAGLIGTSEATVRRAIKNNADEWNQAARSIGQ